MDFFLPRRNLMQQRRRQPEEETRRRKMESHFLNEQDYYDPLFGQSYIGEQRQNSSCNCINCQMEQYLNQDGRQDIVDRKSKQQPSRRKILYDKIRKNSVSDNSDSEDVESDSEKYVQIFQKEPMMNRHKSENDSDQEDKTVEEEKFEDGNFKMTQNVEKEKTMGSFKEEEDNEPKVEENEISRGEEFNSKINLIEEIQEEVRKQKIQIDKFSGNVKNKAYLYCEEILTRCLLKLDNILANGDETIRKARKQVVDEIYQNVQFLEEKLSL